MSRRVLILSVLTILFWPLTSSNATLYALERDLNFNSQQQALEAARHLYRIEGDIQGAKLRLEKLIKQSQNQEVLTQAHYLLGRIFSQQGNNDSSQQSFKVALAGKGLPTAEKLWLYHKLVSFNPNSVQPITLVRTSKMGPTRIFRDKINNKTHYALEFRGPPDMQWERSKEIQIQDEDGNLKPAGILLSGREEILDADATQGLIYNSAAKKIALRPFGPGKTWEITTPARVDVGGILKADPGSFVLLGSGFLNYYRLGKLEWEAPLDQEGCAWISNPEKSEVGILQCTDNNFLLADIRRRNLQPILGIKDKALQVTWEKGFLAIRYIDRFDIRAGPAYDVVKWGLSSQLQEKLVLGNGHVYLISPKGLVKSYQLESGQLEWQRDLLASQMVAYDGSIFVSTFAQTIICLDLNGKLNWTYEYGWDREPIVLPNENFLVLQYGDGRRIKLNRDLLRITGNANGFKLTEYRIRESRNDLKGALSSLDKVLTIEPGNGEAWKLRANTLKIQGAPRQEMVTSLIESARSQVTPNWSIGPVLKNLSTGLGANWIWKRQFGPKFYPNLNPHKENSFYLENDNQTLVLLNHESGGLVNSFHFSEELDMKVSLWKNDTICVSSPSRLYLLSSTSGSSGLNHFPLKNPVCQAQTISNGLVFSDWYGGLSMLGLPERALKWERKLGQSGLLVGKSKTVEYMDVLDLEGTYYAIQSSSGKTLWSLKLPSGTINETFSNKDFIYAGYSQGSLICIDRTKRTISWIVDFGEQIFSLSGNRENTLVLTTASKKLICVQAATGIIISQVYIQSYLFNRPTVFDNGYWLGTTEPALEKRDFKHELILKYKLPDLPGSPVMFGNSIFIGTLDNFILSFPS